MQTAADVLGTRLAQAMRNRMEIEGEPVKRYRLSYDGTTVGSWDTAREALEQYRRYDDAVRLSGRGITADTVRRNTPQGLYTRLQSHASGTPQW